MLEILRKAGSSKYILFVFGVIILVFIFWGVGPTDSDRGDERTVAKVDGRSITAREYREMLKRQTEYYKGLFKGQFNDEAVRRLDLKHKSLDILISRALALKAARAEGVIAAEKDVQDAIKAIPAFGKDGVFDKEMYFRALSANRIKPAEFEKSVETDIVASRMRERVIKGIAVTDEEVMQAFLKEERKFNLSYVAVDPKGFEPSVKVDEAELKAYFEKNPSDFIVPVRIKAFYAFLGFKEMSKGVKVTDDGVKAYYGLNKGRFYAPEQAQARHILITPDEKDADREKAKKDARAKAEEILRRVKSGEGFAALAKKYSKDTVSAKAGGDLGWFPRGVMVREFEDAVFSLKKGTVSGIVETQFGFHIILLEDKREAREQPLKEVEAGIRETLAKDKANIAARDAASDLEREFRGAASIEGLKKAVFAKPGARPSLTPWITEADAKEDIVRDEKTRFAVFSLKAGEVTSKVETDKGIYVVKAVEREEARVPELAAVTQKVKERVMAGKAREEARTKADEILKKAVGGTDLGSAAKDGKMKMDETGWFTRAQGFVRKIGFYVGDKEKIFELTETSPYYPAPVEHNGKFYLFKLKSTLEADPKGFPLAEDGLRARLMTEKQEDAVHKWLTDLRSKAKIKVFEERL